jgi:hypothetical protein
MTQPDHLDIETPEADAAEQATYADPNEVEEQSAPSSSIEAPEWDALEQSQSIQAEDEYR